MFRTHKHIFFYPWKCSHVHEVPKDVLATKEAHEIVNVVVFEETDVVLSTDNKPEIATPGELTFKYVLYQQLTIP